MVTSLIWARDIVARLAPLNSRQGSRLTSEIRFIARIGALGACCETFHSDFRRTMRWRRFPHLSIARLMRSHSVAWAGDRTRLTITRAKRSGENAGRGACPSSACGKAWLSSDSRHLGAMPGSLRLLRRVYPYCWNHPEHRTDRNRERRRVARGAGCGHPSPAHGATGQGSSIMLITRSFCVVGLRARPLERRLRILDCRHAFLDSAPIILYGRSGTIPCPFPHVRGARRRRSASAAPEARNRTLCPLMILSRVPLAARNAGRGR